jgi:hypothetical protein
MLAAKPAIFIELKLVRRGSLILGCRIVSSFAFSACKGNNDSHLNDSPVRNERFTLNAVLIVIG